MSDERILVRVRPGRVRGAISFSHTGCISVKFAELDSEIFSPLAYRNYQAITSPESKANRDNESSEE